MFISIEYSVALSLLQCSCSVGQSHWNCRCVNDQQLAAYFVAVAVVCPLCCYLFFSVSLRRQPRPLSNQLLMCVRVFFYFFARLLASNWQSIRTHRHTQTYRQIHMRHRNVWCLFVCYISTVRYWYSRCSRYCTRKRRRKCCCAHCTMSVRERSLVLRTAYICTLIIFNLKQVKSAKPINYADANSC